MIKNIKVGDVFVAVRDFGSTERNIIKGKHYTVKRIAKNFEFGIITEQNNIRYFDETSLTHEFRIFESLKVHRFKKLKELELW